MPRQDSYYNLYLKLTGTSGINFLEGLPFLKRGYLICYYVMENLEAKHIDYSVVTNFDNNSDYQYVIISTEEEVNLVPTDSIDVIKLGNKQYKLTILD